jgi:hypothetical protein
MRLAEPVGSLVVPNPLNYGLPWDTPTDSLHVCSSPSPTDCSSVTWYQNRYHAPQDDITTPIDFEAQAKFHRFYFALAEAEAVADANEAPQWLPDSPHLPEGAN